MKRVLFFSHQADFIYGAETVTLELLAQLRRSAEVTPEFASPQGAYFERAQTLVPVHTLPARDFRRSIKFLTIFVWAWLATCVRFFCLVRAQKYDAIIATTLKSMVYAWPMALLPRANVYWHHHDILPRSFWNDLIVRLLARFAEKIIVPSQATKKGLLAAGVREGKVLVIANGVSADRWFPSDERFHPGAQSSGTKARNTAGLKQDIFYIGVVGEISERKGADRIALLIEALQKRAPAIPFQFQVIGAGLSDPDFAARVRERNADYEASGKVQFTGRVEDVPERMRELHALVLLSRQDPFPTVILEAGLSGVPSIAFAVGGVREMISPKVNGVVVENIEELAQELLVWINEPAVWRQFCTSTLTHAQAYFSSARMGREFALLLNANP